MNYLLTVIATLIVVVYVYGARWAFKFTKESMPDATIKDRVLAIVLWPKMFGSKVFKNLQ